MASPPSHSLRLQLWLWTTTEQKTRLLAVLIGIALIPFNIHVYYLNFHDITVNGHGDFFLYWSVGKFLETHSFSDVYTYPSLLAFQESIGSGPDYFGLYVYPPPLAFLLMALTKLNYVPAELVWCFGTLLLYLWAALGREWRWQAAVATMLLPMTASCMAAGQNGFLSAALLIGGLRLTPTRPMMAGVLFGLLCYKPQLGVLVPIALASAREWRAMASAAITVLFIVAVTSMAAGWWIWPAWLATLQGNAQKFTSAIPLDHLMPTVHASINLLGGSPALAHMAQLLTASVAAAATWAAFRRGVGALPMATLLTGTFLVTPYAMAYDMPIVATAIVLVVKERHEAGAAFNLIEIMIVLMAAVMPILLPIPNPRFPMGAVVLVLLFGLIVHRNFTQRSAPAKGSGGGPILAGAQLQAGQ